MFSVTSFAIPEMIPLSGLIVKSAGKSGETSHTAPVGNNSGLMISIALPFTA